MALPHVDEIAGTDRVSDDELELLPHLPKHDGVARKLPDGWERAETDQNITYYISHIDGQTYWEHPDMAQLIEKFESFQEIKYAAYRTAMKLRAIQKLTHLSVVQLAVVKKALLQHGLNEDHNSTIITVIEMESVLVTLFNSAKLTWSNVDPEYCAELTLNWILSCYDSGHTGKIKVVQFKLALTTLCNGSVEEKYQYYFDQISQEGFVRRNTLVHFIRDIILIPAQLQEDSSFLTNDEVTAASSCSQFNEGCSSVRGDQFVSWMMKEPKFIVWMPTMHRLAASETVKHEAKCSVCKMFPIVGLRFRSQKDFNTDFCQGCYFSQKTTKNHKITHPVKEYCFATTTGDDVKDFAKVVRNKISRRHRHKRKNGFLNYHSTNEVTAEEEEEEETVSQLQTVHEKICQLAQRLGDEPDAPSVPFTPAIDQDHLHIKLTELVEENRQLSEEIASLKKMGADSTQEGNEELTAKLEIMQEYTKRLEEEINQLRVLLEQQQHHSLQPRPPSSVSGSVSARDFIGSEENEIDLLVQQMVQAFPTGQEPGVPVYIHDELYQKVMRVSNNAAALGQDVVTCYTPHT